MRTMIIAGNWKMYKDVQETTDLLTQLKAAVPQLPAERGVRCIPPFYIAANRSSNAERFGIQTWCAEHVAT